MFIFWVDGKVILFPPAARTAVLSFMKAKESSTREKDLFRSVKVKNLKL